MVALFLPEPDYPADSGWRGRVGGVSGYDSNHGHICVFLDSISQESGGILSAHSPKKKRRKQKNSHQSKGVLK
jgi:hypothetical protein